MRSAWIWWLSAAPLLAAPVSDGFEQGLQGWTTLAGKQPLVTSTLHVHSGRQAAYSGPPGSRRVMHHDFAEPFVGRLSVWFYDDLEPHKQQAVSVDSPDGELLLFAARDGQHYFSRIGRDYAETTVERREGWHAILFECDGLRTILSIDSTPVRQNERLRRLASVMLGSPWDDSTGWYDDLVAEPKQFTAAERTELERRLQAEEEAVQRARVERLAADRARLATEFRVAPYRGLGVTTPLAREYHQRLMRYVRMTTPQLHDWPAAPGCRYHKVDNHEEHAVRQNATVAFCYATLLLEPDRYDPAVTGVSYAELERDCRALVKYLALSHVSGLLPTGDRRPWGDHWQSALWCRWAGHAAWLVWDRLDDETRILVARMVEHEADRFNTRPPDSGIKSDTKAEENAWNSLVIVLAACMFPQHPRHELWHERARVWQINSFPRQEDLSSAQLVDGQPAKARLSAACLWPDYTLENHDRVHPDYLGCLALLLWNDLCYVPAGERVPDSMWYNVPQVYGVLKTLTAPNVSFYYLNGQDWWPHRHDTAFNIAGLWSVLKQDPEAAWAERAGLAFTAKMHARNTDGRLWERREFNYPNAEEEMMCRYAELYLLHRLHGDGPPPATREAFTASRCGVGIYEYGGFALHRTPEKLASFAWQHGAMGMVFPAGDDDTWFTAPSERSLTGHLACAGATDGPPETLAHRALKLPHGGLAVTVRLKRCGGALVQELAMVSLPTAPVLVVERLTAAREVQVDRIATLTAGILNEHLPTIAPGERTLTDAGGQQTIAGPSAEAPALLKLAGEWVNVDGRLGLRVSTPTLGYHAEHRYLRSRLEQTLIGHLVEQPARFAAGQVISTVAAALVPGQSPAATAREAVAVTTAGERVTVRYAGTSATVSLAAGGTFGEVALE